MRSHMLGDARPPAALVQHTGFLLNWCADRTRRAFAAELDRCCGLHPREFGVLSVIEQADGATQHQLGESAQVDPSTMVQTLDGLQERGLTERRIHPQDRRKRTVHLTEAGREALAKGRQAAAHVHGTAFATLDEGERDELNRLLRKLSGAT